MDEAKQEVETRNHSGSLNDSASITSELNPSSISSEQQPQEILINESNKIFEHLIKEMLESTGEYIKAEVDTCVADYKALERMNRAVTDKYVDMSKQTGTIRAEMTRLNESYTNLLPMLSQIDDVEKCVDSLEQTTLKLDAYSKKLEQRFKQFAEKYLANKA
jgi:hypothetical protein